MFVPAPTGAHAIAEMVTQSTAWTFGLTVDMGTAPSAALLAQLNELIKDWYDTSLKGLLTTNTGLTGVTSYSMVSETAPVIADAISPPIYGSTGSTPIALNAAIVSTLRTAMRGRSGRGRIYLTGLTEAAADSVAWDGTTVSSLDSAWDDLKTAIEAVDWIWVVASKESGGSPRAEALLTPVTGIDVQTRIASQRRRVPRG